MLASTLDTATGQPAFSVIVPCWNAARTIEETLASVRAQTLADFEVILVDDGSTDGTPAILQAVAKSDRRMRVVRQANRGPGFARNHAAFHHARGRYLAFLDSDDLWAPEKLECVAAAFTADPALAGLYGRTVFFRDRPETARTVSRVSTGALRPRDLLRGNATCTMSNVVVRADAFRASGGFDPTMSYSEDLEWLVRFTAAGHRLEALDLPLVYYRSSDGGLSINLEKMHAGWRRAAASAKACDPAIDETFLLAAEAIHLRFLARRALRGAGPRAAALGLAVRGVARSPFGFFANPAHGVLTLLAACAQPLLPAGLRRLALQS